MVVKFFAGLLSLSLTLAALPACAQDDAWRTGRWADGSQFRFHYMVDFWRKSPPGTTLDDTPDAQAPGYIAPIEVSLQDKTITKSEAAIFGRKTRIIAEAVLAQSPFKDIRGYSIRPFIRIHKNRFGKLSAGIEMLTLPVKLSDPRTTETNGRYFTPGEAPVLRIKVNSTLEWLNEIPVSKGLYNGTPTGEAKGEPFFYIATNGRSPLVSACCDYKGRKFEEWNKDFYDPSLPGTKVQYVAGMVLYANYRRGALWDATVPPDAQIPRMVAALFLVDWQAVMRRVEAAG